MRTFNSLLFLALVVLSITASSCENLRASKGTKTKESNSLIDIDSFGILNIRYLNRGIVIYPEDCWEDPIFLTETWERCDDCEIDYIEELDWQNIFMLAPSSINRITNDAVFTNHGDSIYVGHVGKDFRIQFHEETDVSLWILDKRETCKGDKYKIIPLY